MNFRRRIEGLQDRMLDLDLDLVVYGAGPNFQYLTGSLVEWRRGRDLTSPKNNVFITPEGDPVMTLDEGSKRHEDEAWIKDVRVLERKEDAREAIKGLVGDLVEEPGRVGVGEYLWGSTVLDLAVACKGAKFSKAGNLLNEIRMIKEEEEISRLRKVAQLTEEVMEEIIPKVDRGISQRQLALDVEMEGRERGARDVSFPSTAGYVKTGSEPTEGPFNYPPDKGLEQETSIAFDVGFVLDGYCSDWGRSMYFGRPDEDISEGYNALQNSVVETVDEMAPGSMRVCDIYPSIEEKLDDAGYGEFLRARLKTGSVGHQIGVEVHEEPRLRPGNYTSLQEGMVFCVEPKIWDNGRYYLRVEDMVLVTSRGAEFLTTYDRNHFTL
ncbi:MAG: M24 family metallopeptidase [Candidatus Bathyarchaeia archaeon]